jgi:hypothetical protein
LKRTPVSGRWSEKLRVPTRRRDLWDASLWLELIWKMTWGLLILHGFSTWRQ